MAEWILILWMVNCGWNCKTLGMPEYEPFKTEYACTESLLKWTQVDSFAVKPRKHWNRDGECVEKK